MAAGKSTYAVDRVTPKQDGGLRVIFSKSAADETAIAISAKDDNDYITKKIYNDNSPNRAPIVTAIVGGVTGNPITVSYGTMIWPMVFCRNSDGSIYSGAQNTVDDGANIILTGDSDGSGHFIDSFNFIIKQ